MDLNAIKAKLDGLNAPKKKYEKVDYTKIYWKPKVGKQVIRVVTSKFDPENPFRELYLHYGFKKFPMVSLKTYGEKDPIDEFASSLFKGSDKSDWELGNKLKSKPRVFVPIIVRGEEEKGVRLWEVGVTTYKQLMAIAADEDYGDYSLIVGGRDLTVEGTEKESFGRQIVAVDIRPKPKTSDLSEDAEQVKLWLENQPNPDELFKKFSFDELKEILQNYLTPTEDDVVEDDDDAETTEDEVNEKASVTTTTKTKAGTAKGPNTKVKASNSAKFDTLFEE